MVAITVILAAVIGTFVLGLGEQVQSNAPQAQFDFNFDTSSTGASPVWTGSGGDDGDLTVTHESGKAIPAARLTISADDGSSISGDDGDAWGSGDVTAGDSAEVQVDSVDSVRVIWESQDGGNSDTLREWEGPDA